MQISVRPVRVRELLHRWIASGLRAADPALALRQILTRTRSSFHIGPKRFSLRDSPRFVVVGAGKASAHMARALEGIVGDRIKGGLVIVKYGHAVPTKKVRILQAGHPVPDRAGQRATSQLLKLIHSLTRTDVLFVLLSGGASSLLPAPSPGLTLADKQQTTRLLLNSGATIQEINSVRSHLSGTKGGRLVGATSASVISLILSDVIGDPLHVIGSGPTAPDPTTFSTAREILCRYGLWSTVPFRVRRHIVKGIQGKVSETPKPGSARFRRVHNSIIANNNQAVEAVAGAVKQSGVSPVVLSTTLVGDAREAAIWFGSLAKEIVGHGRPLPKPVCCIAGGELTVTVKGKGRGGRAQEFALAAACEISGLKNVWVGALGTDGTDGPTEVAGAVVNGKTLTYAKRFNIDLVKALRNNDSYRVFRRLGGHIVTGPTGTNVNDLYFLLIL